ncbi:MAG: AAA family ATPase [Oligosphaeraceae bacterium]
MSESERVRIASLELENVKRVRAVALAPTAEGLTVIGGRNRQGKTSILDGIAYALGGEKRRPSELQNRGGMAQARMEVRLSNGLVVVREGRNAALKVLDPTGRKAGQKLLDSFIGEFSLDLPKFLGLDSRRKGEALLGLVPERERLEELDRRERRLCDERLIAGREAERKRHYADTLEEHPEAPSELVSAAEVSGRLEAALAENGRRRQARDRIAQLRLDLDARTSDLEAAQERMAEAERRLEAALQLKASAEHVLANALAEPVPDDLDTAPIAEELRAIDETNAKVRVNLEKARALDEAKQAEEEHRALSGQIDAVREERRALLATVRWPLEGLSLDGQELTYDGQKWDCMSSSEQMRVATSICQALKPECGFILLDKLEQFDPQELASFGEWLRERGLQAIGTRVSVGDECAVVIEDGMVAGEDNPPAPQLVEDSIGGF